MFGKFAWQIARKEITRNILDLVNLICLDFCTCQNKLKFAWQIARKEIN